MEINVRVPRVPNGLAANLLGLLGLLAVALAVGGLTGNWWWSILAGGVFAFGLAVVAQMGAQEQAPPAAVLPPPVDLAVVAAERAREDAYMRGKAPATA